VPGGGEVLAADFDQDDRGGPEPTPGIEIRTLEKRVRIHQFFDLGGDLAALTAQRRQLLGQLRQHL